MKRIICVLTALLCLCMAGCTPPPRRQTALREGEGVKIYLICKDENGRKYIDYEKRDVEATEPAERAEELLSMLKSPKSRGAYKEIPDHLNFASLSFSEDVLHIDFSRSYRYLSDESIVIVSTLICKTLLDDGIAKYIRITCGGEAQPPMYDGYISADTLHIAEKMYIE